MKWPHIWAADVFAFITRKTIICRKRIVKGASMRNGICGNQRGIIVSDNGKPYESYPTLAHEIAHTMGVPHDGEGSSQGCPAIQEAASGCRYRRYNGVPAAHSRGERASLRH
nr:uncharacterized protein LOC119165426 [Rhipicephalus microplus]